ncbi:MAG TPA: FecR domain-containing protein [Opitutaceae bacterium]|nr:FecR domain-containing protein [Opitutaceae bacterium]
MSTSSHRDSRPLSSRPIENEEAQWISWRDAGLTPAQEQELQAWLARDARHGIVLERLGSAWAALDHPDFSADKERHVRTLAARAKTRRRRQFWGASTAVALLAFALILLLPFGPKPESEIEALALPGRPQSQRLADGSLVELNSDAEIVVEFSELVRSVRLVRGEAHFQVAHEPDRPFLVSAGSVAVKAVGTAFTVRFDPQVVEVLVTEGRVVVDDKIEPRHNALETIGAGNRVVVPTGESGAAMRVMELSGDELSERLAWREVRLEFSGTALGEAVASFNERNRTQVSIADPSLAKLKISGIFRADNLDGFIRLMEDTLELQSVVRGTDTIVLERRR